MPTMDDVRRAVSPRFSPPPTPLRSMLIHGGITVLWMALFARGCIADGPFAWSSGMVYLSYDTCLLLFIMWQTLPLARPRPAAAPSPGAAPVTLGVIVAARNEAEVPVANPHRTAGTERSAGRNPDRRRRLDRRHRASAAGALRAGAAAARRRRRRPCRLSRAALAAAGAWRQGARPERRPRRDGQRRGGDGGRRHAARPRRIGRHSHGLHRRSCPGGGDRAAGPGMRTSAGRAACCNGSRPTNTCATSSRATPGCARTGCC